MEFNDIIGTIAATLTTASLLPQAIKVIKTKSTKDISLGMYIVFTTGISLWLVYGILTMQFPVIFSNATGLPLCIIILWFKLKEKNI